jgi:hypothetical protein
MAEPWEQQPGEPNIWHQRFARHYLPLGPERSVDKAYRDRMGARTGSEPAAKSPRRAPGSWQGAAAEWKWLDRAAAWDRHEIQVARSARLRAVRRTQEKHLTVAAALLGRVIGRIQEIGFDAATDPLKLVGAARDLVGLERLIHEAPIDAEANRQIERDHDGKQVTEVSTWDVTPEDLVAVAAGWAQLGISIHDDPPVNAAGPVAALGAPVTGPAGSQ